MDSWAPPSDRYRASGDKLIGDLLASPERVFEEASHRLAFFGDRVNIVREDTSCAASLFKDGRFDLVFIDAEHTEGAVRSDIRLWLPKVTAGGWLGGHDLSRPEVGAAVVGALEHFQTGSGDTWWYRRGDGCQ